MENSSTTHSSEPAPDAGESPFHSSAKTLVPTPPAVRAVGHSTRVADIIMLTVVVAVLLAIAAHYAGLSTPQDREPRDYVIAGIGVGLLVGLLSTLLVQHNIIASLYGAAVGSALGAALPSLLWDEGATTIIAIGCSVMLVVGAILGTPRRRSEAAARPAAGEYGEH